MSTLILRSSDRPPKRGQSHLGEASVFVRVLLGSIFALCLVVSLAVTAWAQDGRPVRTDPGDPPAIPGGTDEGWQVLTIPGLPPNATLGDVWAGPNGDVYVWATYRTPVSITSDEPVEGEKLPNRGNLGPVSSLLYRFNGVSWTVALAAPGKAPGTVYGTGPADVYASTIGTQGEAYLYRFNGSAWAVQTLPGFYVGKLHTLTGGPGDVYFRIDRVLMRDIGTGMQPVYELPGDETPVHGLVYYGQNQVMMMCPEGCVFQNNGVYSEVPAGFTLGDVQDSWGMLNTQGVLQIFAIGTSMYNEGIRVWRFTETDPLTHTGDWLTVLGDPPQSGNLDVGTGTHIWGTATNDIYATGVVVGEGHIVHFDGTAWTHLFPPTPFEMVHGVWGTINGTTWFSTDAGKMIRYQRPAQTLIAGVPAPPVERTFQPLAAKQFQGGMQIRYELAKAAPVHLGVYDLAGRLCATVEEGFRTSGVHETTWDTSALVPGIYFVNLRAGGPAFSRRVVVLH